MRESGLVRLLAVFVASIALVPGNVAAAPQDDFGTGNDAPNDPGSAVDVGPSGNGILAPEDSDFQDWYRVTVPAGKGIHVSLSSPTGGLQLEIRSDDQSFVTNACCNNGPSTWSELYAYTSGTAYRIGVSACCSGGPYALTTEAVDLFDLSIAAVRVVNRPIMTDAVDAPVSTQRTIEIDVGNNGPGGAFQSGVNVRAEHEFSGGRDVGNAGIPFIAPGGQTTVSIPWDATGQVGDVALQIDVGGPLDSNWQNNHATVTWYALVGNVGGGADLASHRVGDCNEAQCTTVATGYHNWGKGLWFDRNANDGSQMDHVHVGTHPGTTHVEYKHRDPSWNVGVDVWSMSPAQVSICPADGSPCVV
ncbi:MAG: hypothetical protein HY556_04095 [Euryarchaeota archaeon]|nr:hypothetical protein [Euryarchaeota archaeon]